MEHAAPNPYEPPDPKAGAIRIAFLADHPELIPTVADWFRAIWPDYYGPQDPADVLDELQRDASRERLPVRLIAFLHDEPAGTVVLRDHALSSRPNVQPGLGGLCVTPALRQHGVGVALVQAGMELAASLGYEQLYAATSTAHGLLLRLGWERIETLDHHGQHVALYQRPARMVLGDA